MKPIAVLKGAAQCGELNAAYLYGLLIKKDSSEEAFKYLSKVIKGGFADVACDVGKQYYQDKDIENAIRYFDLGIDEGDLGSALSLGLMYTTEESLSDQYENGKQLLNAVCEASEQNSDIYNYAKAQLERIAQKENSAWGKITKGFRSLFNSSNK